MDWFNKAATQAKEAAAKAQQQLADQMKEAGVSDKLAPVSTAAADGASFFKSIGSTLESSFNSTVATTGKKGEVSLDSSGAPWVTSHLGLKAYEADMKASMLKIAEGSDDEVRARFTEKIPDDDFEFDFCEPNNTARAMAALEADPNLKAIRHKFVPSQIKEEVFWRAYFYKCEVIVKSYLKMCVDNKRDTNVDRYPDPSDNVDAEFASDDVVNASMSSDAVKNKAKQELGLSWEEEMAKELEGIDTQPPSKDSKQEKKKEVIDLDDDDFEKELGL